MYGHAVQRNGKPRVDTFENTTMIGVDTGCCFGLALTAVVFDGDHYEFAYIAAKRQYRTYPHAER